MVLVLLERSGIERAVELQSEGSRTSGNVHDVCCCVFAAVLEEDEGEATLR